MNIRLLTTYVGFVILGAFLMWMITKFLQKTGPADFDACFLVDLATPPTPHADVADRFCVRRQSGGAWRLIPDANMTDWKPFGGGAEIPLTLKYADDNVAWSVLQFEFDVNVNPHSGQNHNNDHTRPNTGFKLNITNGQPMDAKIRGFGPVGAPIHGGTAHGQQD